MMARKDQLKIEYETLRTAHVQTLSQVLEEQQKRVEAEKSYSQRLEQEVERRSAELREALDDATRKSLKLQQYSISLENANVALEELNRAAAAANEAKTQFLAAVSHELRTPMTAILGYSELLLEESTPGSKQRESLQIVKRNGEHLLEVINNILDLAKIESGKMDIRLTEFSIEHVIAAQCDMARPLTEKKNIDLNTEIQADLPPLFQDQARVQQILNNLLSNAIKFTPEGGRILVTAQRNERSELVLRVVDTGVGITAEDQQLIFEKFRQGRTAMPGGDAMTREYSGTGLGLSIVKELCKLLGGEVSVESELGTGSAFTVHLPWHLDRQPRLESPLATSFQEFTKARFDAGHGRVPAEVADRAAES